MLTITVNMDGLDEIILRLAKSASKAEHTLAKQVFADTDQFVPALTGRLADARVEGNLIIYEQPYARYLYIGKVRVDPITHAAGFLTEGGWKSRKGIRKVLTDRNLNIQQSVHEQAQSHWFEASKKQNLEKWIRGAGRMVVDELG